MVSLALEIASLAADVQKVSLAVKIVSPVVDVEIS
jgi:hypothetical protein